MATLSARSRGTSRSAAQKGTRKLKSSSGVQREDGGLLGIAGSGGISQSVASGLSLSVHPLSTGGVKHSSSASRLAPTFSTGAKVPPLQLHQPQAVIKASTAGSDSSSRSSDVSQSRRPSSKRSRGQAQTGNGNSDRSGPPNDPHQPPAFMPIMSTALPSSVSYQPTSTHPRGPYQPTSTHLRGPYQPTSTLPRGPDVDLPPGTDLGGSFAGGIEQPRPERTAAAIRIQRWYRAVKRDREQALILQILLANKKSKLNQSLGKEEIGIESLSQERMDIKLRKKKHKEQKAKDSRQAAILSLQKMREEKKLLAQAAAENEYALLEASGRVKPARLGSKQAPGSGVVVGQRPPSSSSSSTAAPVDSGSVMAKDDTPSLLRPGGTETGGTREREVTPGSVDAIFDANSTYRPPPPKLVPSGAENGISSRPTSSGGRASGQGRTQGDRMADILEALKILEEAPLPLAPPQPRLRSPRTSGAATADRIESTHPQASQTDYSKFSDILAYLDGVDASTSETMSQVAAASTTRTEGLMPPSLSSRTTKYGPLTPPALLPAASNASSRLEAASSVAGDVTSAIQSLRMEVQDKNRTVEMLQKALAQQRELTVYHAKEQEKEGNRRLVIQKEEYETTIKRHLGFIDRLIDDKKTLNERCEKLLAQLKELERQSTMKIKTLEERHSIELERQRENLVRAEKQRRDKWMQEQSKRIKEVTVKGLEPEIQRLIAKHKAELFKVKALHEADLMQADERASRRYLQQTQELRDQLQREKEAECAREREVARSQYEKAASQEESSFQQQRRRLYAEVEEEKERLSLLATQQRSELDSKMREMMESHSKSILECKSEYERSISEQEHRHSTELRNLSERFKIEKDAWEENYMRKQEAVLLAKERELKGRMRKDRDKEIELVISRLEEETRMAKEECEQTADSRIRRVRDKYENELKEVERSERAMRDKYTANKEQLVAAQGDVVDLKALVKKKEAEVGQISEVSSKLTRERDNITDVVRQEFADRLVSTEEENKSVKTGMSELKARHKVELEQVQKRMEAEMERVHERVKQAILKKEEAMKTSRDQHDAALKRAEHLEMLLERQRQELLKK